MTPATLTPPTPKEEAAPERVAVPAVAPTLPVHAPLSRAPRREPTGRLTRNALAASLLAHLLLGLAVVLAPGAREGEEAAAPGAATGTEERVSYLDVGDWPTEVPSGGAAAASPAQPATGEEPAISAAAADSAIARVDNAPAPLRFPSAVPGRIPPAPAGPARGAQAGGGPGAAPGARGTGTAGAGTGNGIPGNPAGGRLGPGYGDRRLIVRPEAVPERELTEHEKYERHLAQRLEAYNDSVADQAARDSRARNWTWKDKNGREWGIAEGGVPVVAGRRLPTRVEPPGMREGRDREDARRRERQQRAEIDNQADRIDRDRNFRERTEAIRRRRDEERRKRQEETEAGERSGQSEPATTPTP